MKNLAGPGNKINVVSLLASVKIMWTELFKHETSVSLVYICLDKTCVLRYTGYTPNLVPRPCLAFRHFQYSKAMKSWAGPGYEASILLQFHKFFTSIVLLLTSVEKKT